MNTYYTDERNTQILISLMKSHGVRKVVASPGTTNIAFVASIQQDDYFEIYSSVDERSAAYIACGLAEESGEPVALSCTGATASRNYISALTEAYYRKLPILAITSAQHWGRIGQNIPQAIDRTSQMNDIVKLSVQIPSVNNQLDEWACNVSINKALLELRHKGNGPVHINLATTYSENFTIKELPKERIINRFQIDSCMPKLGGKVAVLVGTHSKWSSELLSAVDEFCKLYNGVVICDHTSNYSGKYKVLASLVCNQTMYEAQCRRVEVLIHIGNIEGVNLNMHAKEVWRVNPDGEIRDTFKKLTNVFEMDEIVFFRKYIELIKNTPDYKEGDDSYLKEWTYEYESLLNSIPEVPFSNIWIAKNTASRLPVNSVLHLGILNSLRSWNFFELNNSIACYSNTGGFGIDGLVSTLIGASLASKDKLYFGVVGDLAMFYDLNSIGNRHVGNNIRLMVINNGRGVEFRNYNHKAAQFGSDADAFIAAAGHFGNQSEVLLKHFATDLGFEYLCASNKDEYYNNIDKFVTPEITDKPMIFELFTSIEDESNALKTVNSLRQNTIGKVGKVAKSIVGQKGVDTIKKVIKW